MTWTMVSASALIAARLRDSPNRQRDETKKVGASHYLSLMAAYGAEREPAWRTLGGDFLINHTEN